MSGAAAGAGVLLPSGALAARGEDPVERVLRRIERRSARIEARMAPARAHVPAVDGAEGDAGFYDALRDAMVASLVYAEIGRLPVEDQVHPRVQDALWGAAEGMGRSMRLLAGRLESMDAERWAALEGATARNDDQLDVLADAVVAEVDQLGLPPVAARQLDKTVRERVFEVRQRGLRRTVEGLVGRFRKTEASVARSADPFDAVRLATPPEASARVGRRGGGALSGGGRMRATGGADAALGALLLGIGAVGLVMLVIGTVGSGVGWIACLCVSVPLVAGTILVLAAGIALVSGG
jgi:hypothetical protein